MGFILIHENSGDLMSFPDMFVEFRILPCLWDLTHSWHVYRIQRLSCNRPTSLSSTSRIKHRSREQFARRKLRQIFDRPPEDADLAADGVAKPHVTRPPGQPAKGGIVGADIWTWHQILGLLCGHVRIVQAEEYYRTIVVTVVHHLGKNNINGIIKNFDTLLYEKIVNRYYSK